MRIPACRQYRLEGTEPVPEPDMLAWVHWFETADRTVATTQVTAEIEVATVFLGLALTPFWTPWCVAAPALFETMIFGGPLNLARWRYATWHTAEQGHEAMVERVRQTLRERVP
jgi:hypothetical protein